MVNIDRTPIKHATAGNPVVFAFSSTTSDVRLFEVDVIEQSTLSTIFTGKVYPTPNTPQVGYFNASNALSSLVKSDVDNTNTLMIGKTLPIIGYQLNVTDVGIVSGLTLPLSTGITTSTRYAYEGKLDIPFYTNDLDNTTFVITTGQTDGRFLTNQPNFKKVNEWSSEQLYLIQDGISTVDMVVSTTGGTSTFSFTGSPDNVITITPAIPEVRANGYIAITGSTGTGGNIRVRVLTPLGYVTLGTYVAQTSGLTTTQIATGLYNNMVVTSSGTGYGLNLNGNLITITAPVGSGAAANLYSLESDLSASTVSFSFTESGIPAFTTISGYSLTSANTNTAATILTNDVIRGNIYIANINITDTMVGNISAFTAALVSSINNSGYGYLAFQTATNRFTVNSPYRSGVVSGCSVYNGMTANLDLTTGSSNFTFTGGTDDEIITETYSGLTVIPNSITGFTGGANAIPAVTQAVPEKMVRLQVSPKRLEASGVTLNIGDTYGIQIKSGSTALSEIKYYRVEEAECYNYTNVFFTNSQGGVDTIQMLEPRINYNSERKSIIKNNINLEEETVYKTDERFNMETLVYSNQMSAKVTLTTKPLDDLQTNWLAELVGSKEIYFELNNGDLIPVTLDNTDYLLQKRRLNTGRPIQIEFTFSLPVGFVDLYKTNNSIIINS